MAQKSFNQISRETHDIMMTALAGDEHVEFLSDMSPQQARRIADNLNGIEGDFRRECGNVVDEIPMDECHDSPGLLAKYIHQHFYDGDNLNWENIGKMTLTAVDFIRKVKSSRENTGYLISKLILGVASTVAKDAQVFISENGGWNAIVEEIQSWSTTKKVVVGVGSAAVVAGAAYLAYRFVPAPILHQLIGGAIKFGSQMIQQFFTNAGKQPRQAIGPRRPVHRSASVNQASERERWENKKRSASFPSDDDCDMDLARAISLSIASDFDFDLQVAQALSLLLQHEASDTPQLLESQPGSGDAEDYDMKLSRVLSLLLEQTSIAERNPSPTSATAAASHTDAEKTFNFDMEKARVLSILHEQELRSKRTESKRVASVTAHDDSDSDCEAEAEYQQAIIDSLFNQSKTIHCAPALPTHMPSEKPRSNPRKSTHQRRTMDYQLATELGLPSGIIDGNSSNNASTLSSRQPKIVPFESNNDDDIDFRRAVRLSLESLDEDNENRTSSIRDDTKRSSSVVSGPDKPATAPDIDPGVILPWSLSRSLDIESGPISSTLSQASHSNTSGRIERTKNSQPATEPVRSLLLGNEATSALGSKPVNPNTEIAKDSYCEMDQLEELELATAMSLSLQYENDDNSRSEKPDVDNSSSPLSIESALSEPAKLGIQGLDPDMLMLWSLSRSLQNAESGSISTSLSGANPSRDA